MRPGELSVHALGIKGWRPLSLVRGGRPTCHGDDLWETEQLGWPSKRPVWRATLLDTGLTSLSTY